MNLSKNMTTVRAFALAIACTGIGASIAAADQRDIGSSPALPDDPRGGTPDRAKQPSPQVLFNFLAAYVAKDSKADFDGNKQVDERDIYAFLEAYLAGKL